MWLWVVLLMLLLSAMLWRHGLPFKNAYVTGHAQAQWAGTRVPSQLYSLSVGGIFKLLLCLGTQGYLATQSTKQSAELRALNFLLFTFRYFQSADLTRIRIPLLGVITPLQSEFIFELERFQGLDIFVLDPAVMTRAGAAAESVILYVHGGGFVSGDFGGFRAMVYEMAQRTRLPLVFPHYRLTPEHDIVDQVADVMTALRYSAQRYKLPFLSVIIVGDSAGGALVLLALQRLTAEHMPQRAILISPVTDLSCSGDSFFANRHTCIFRPEIVRICMDLARTRFFGQDPAVSPLYGNFTGLPPLFFIASSSEIFADDTRRAVIKAKAAGVAVTLQMHQHVPHAFPTFYFAAPECAAGLEQVISWILQK